MEVIPAINCLDFECVRERMLRVSELGVEWAHFDVSDGKFAPVVTWNDPSALATISGVELPKFEVHLMVEKPEEYVDFWVRAGARRLIVHVEAVDSAKFKVQNSKLEVSGCELGMAVLSGTPIESVLPYLEDVRFVQFLAVSPGFSGQKFDEQVLEKIRALRERDSEVTVEVDGGVNLETAKLVREAGADVVVSSSFIFDASDPKIVYNKLRAI